MAKSGEQRLREHREAIVNEHVAAENRHDVDATIATFHSARYEVNGEPSDGEGAVRDLLSGLMAGFPDFHAELDKLHHTDAAVVCEGRMTGTHDGPWEGVPATGRRVALTFACIFDFEEDRLVCEKVFVDFATLLRQVGALPEPAPA